MRFGKSAAERLALLEARMDDEPAQELSVTAAEPGQITHLRLDQRAGEP